MRMSAGALRVCPPEPAKLPRCLSEIEATSPWADCPTGVVPGQCTLGNHWLRGCQLFLVACNRPPCYDGAKGGGIVWSFPSSSYSSGRSGASVSRNWQKKSAYPDRRSANGKQARPRRIFPNCWLWQTPWISLWTSSAAGRCQPFRQRRPCPRLPLQPVCGAYGGWSFWQSFSWRPGFSWAAGPSIPPRRCRTRFPSPV